MLVKAGIDIRHFAGLRLIVVPAKAVAEVKSQIIGYITLAIFLRNARNCHKKFTILT